MWHPLVERRRGDIAECVYYGGFAIVHGRTLLSGQAEREPIFLRSLSKPLMGKALYSSLPPLKARLHAMTLSSHNGEACHVQLVRELLGAKNRGLLQTPRSLPLGGGHTRHTSRLFHPCSGEHGGLLLACRAQRWDPRTYRATEHPVTQKYLAYLKTCLGESWEPCSTATDGCGLPTHGMPIAEVATLYARLAVDRDADRVWASATLNPQLIGGHKRLDSYIMGRCNGLVFSKEGADGLLALAIVHERFPQGLGVAIKLTHGWDGATMSHAASAVLQQFGFEVPPTTSAEPDVWVSDALRATCTQSRRAA